MTPLPKEPTGSSSVVGFAKRIIKILRERKTIAGEGIKVDFTAEGERISVDPDALKKGTSGPPLWG